MLTTRWLMTAILGLVLTGCAGMHATPTPEARQALAPTGKLRVGLLLGRPLSVTRDPASGEMKGVGFDLGKEFARRMGVPFEPVMYPSIRPLLDGVKSGQWDIAFLVVSVAQAKEVDFTAPHLEIELGYPIPGASPISTLADVDRPGIRVAVPEKGGSDTLLTRALKNAVVLRGSDAGALEMLKSGGSRGICRQQANPVRDVESVAWFPSSRRSFCHRAGGYGHPEGTGPRNGVRAQIR